MGLGPFNPDCECCECKLASDSFDRANSTDIGGAWREVAEDWSINGNYLRVAAANAVVRHLTEHPDGIPALRAKVVFRAADAGDQAHILLPMWGDSDFYTAQFEVGAECGVMRLLDDVGNPVGDEVVVVDLVPDQWHVAVVCFVINDYPSLDYWLLKITTASGVVRWIKIEPDSDIELTPDADGFTAGLGTGDLTALMEFNDFLLYKTKTVADPECPDCLPDDCEIALDRFNRADSDDPGCQWEEESGDWDIVSNKLKAMTQGRIRCLVPHPTGHYWAIEADITGANFSNVYFIADYDPVAGTYVYGRVMICESFGFGDFGLLEIGDETGPIKTKSLIRPPQGMYQLCVTPDLVIFKLYGLDSAMTIVVREEYATRGGRFAAIEADALVTIDNWHAQIHGHADMPDCPDCYGEEACTNCVNVAMPAAFLVTFPTSGWDGAGIPIAEPGESYVVETGAAADASCSSGNTQEAECAYPGVEEEYCLGRRCHTIFVAGAFQTFFIQVWITKRSGNYYVRVVTGYSPSTCWAWELDMGTEPVDCLNLAGLSLPFVYTNHGTNPSPDPVIIDSL